MALVHRKLLFVHIEKTAGTSVRDAIETAIGRQYVAVYSPRADRLAMSSDSRPATALFLDLMPRAWAHPVLGKGIAFCYPIINWLYIHRLRHRYPVLEIVPETKVILGHFTSQQFESFLPSPLRAIIIRDPLERMRSHYDHWKRKRGQTDWRVCVPFQKNMTFEEFAFLPQLQNYQMQVLDGVPLYDFDIVGVTERTELFIQHLLQFLQSEGFFLDDSSFDFLHGKKFNTTPPNRRTDLAPLDQGWRDSFLEFHSQDYALYSVALHLSLRAKVKE